RAVEKRSELLLHWRAADRRRADPVRAVRQVVLRLGQDDGRLDGHLRAGWAACDRIGRAAAWYPVHAAGPMENARLLPPPDRGRRPGACCSRTGRGEGTMSSGVVVGDDGSDCAKAALRTAIEVGRAYGEKVIVAFGYDLNPVAGEIRDYHAALHE